MAKSLSNMSKASFCEQVGISVQSSFEDEKKVLCNRESISHMKPEQTVECVTYKVGTCRHCGDKEDGTDCLVCDSCEEMYHLSCIKPAVIEIPRKSWFCASCTASGIGCLHENCVVCERLNVPKTLDHIVGEESIPTNEETLNKLEENLNCTYDGIQVSTGGRNSSDCKICKMVVDGEKLKICGHSFCPSKYYHIRCLSSKQMKSYGRCWYCPSCICQVCLTDKDDDKIVLCDGCDHAYHIYCMKPPRHSIPRGKWFCIKCDAGIQVIRQARKVYESNKGEVGQSDSKPNENIDKKWNKKRGCELDKVGGMDMLITAANTLNSEEDVNAIQIDSKSTLT
ncbi:PHD finger protein EHD3 [Mucuna pruriens]|uniref:PHD finger protein EHD3 n=1 Tax=Mucuna pruriens TaxID=157652 RepID=A0A371FLN8_MUCPR|nr:PHD finger protein EHD3 [Mucuna pruriens]